MTTTAAPPDAEDDEQPLVELHTRVPRRARAVLERLAAEDRRTVAFMAREAVCEFVAARADITETTEESHHV